MRTVKGEMEELNKCVAGRFWVIIKLATMEIKPHELEIIKKSKLQRIYTIG